MANRVVNVVTGSNIGAANTVYINQGDEIDLQNRKTLGLWVEFTVNDSTTNLIKLLFRHTAGDTTEYTLVTAGDYIKTLGDATIKIYYEFDLKNAMPFVQIQSKAAVVGATKGTLTINYTLG